ncbi:MAG: DUF1127 domain-containing protein [Rhizobiales bacterium]|nr:DUF1127 domain-containing protein [Hyphomicrobiales bacterium]
MNIGCATDDLLHQGIATRAGESRMLALVLRIEAWFAARASARSLYGLDDRALADLGLSRADVEAVNAKAGVVNPIPSL